jgi:hypothetical protein
MASYREARGKHPEAAYYRVAPDNRNAEQLKAAASAAMSEGFRYSRRPARPESLCVCLRIMV